MKVSADYRMLALDALRGKWKTAVLTGVAASALGATIVGGSNSVASNANQRNDINFKIFSQPNGGRLLAVLLVSIGLWAIFTLIVGGAAASYHSLLHNPSFSFEKVVFPYHR